MYVNNTNLLHWPESSATDPEELNAHVQTATTDYGQLAQASGGILKAKKVLSVFSGLYIYPWPGTYEVITGPPSPMAVYLRR